MRVRRMSPTAAWGSASIGQMPDQQSKTGQTTKTVAGRLVILRGDRRVQSSAFRRVICGDANDIFCFPGKKAAS